MKRVTFPNPQQTFCHMAYLNFNIFVMISTFPLLVIPYLLSHNSDFFYSRNGFPSIKVKRCMSQL